MSLKRIVPAILVFLFLCGCAAVGEPPSPSPTESAVHAPSLTASPLAPTPTTGKTPRPTAPAGKAITEEELRALYEGEEVIITPYKGDYLVQYGGHGWDFDWVYGKTGERYRIMRLNEGVREVEILETGVIRVLTNGISSVNGSKRFPVFVKGYSVARLNEYGKPTPYDRFYGGILIFDTYWADITEPCSFGHARREALANALVDAAGAQFVFGPPADPIAFQAFYTAYSDVPVTEISFDEESRVMTLLFRNTSLSSGDLPEYADEQEEKRHWEMLDYMGVTLPTEFPAGELYGSNPHISRATVEEDGEDTVAKLYLTEKAGKYTIEEGKVGSLGCGPYFRIIFRDDRGYE